MEKYKYCTTWGTSLRLLPKECNPPINLSNNSLRQIFKISLGGNKFRLRLSNYYGKENLEIKYLSISNCIEQGTSKICLDNNKLFKFNNSSEIIISKGEEIYTDILSINLESSSEIAITIFFGNSFPNEITGHKFPMVNSYIEKGNKINKETFSNEYIISHWYFISNIELVSEQENQCIICFGDSITDGRFSSMNKEERWPDFLYQKIKKEKPDLNMAVINQGLSGSFLTKEGIERFDKDVLEQNGMKYAIILYGINDITKLNKGEKEIIDKFKEIIKKTHEKNIKIFAGTILPFKQYRLYNDQKNTVRNKINDWIRNCKNIEQGFDDFIDFDLIIRDEDDINKIKDIYNSGDGAHPNSLGYKKMVDAFTDLNIFIN